MPNTALLIYLQIPGVRMWWLSSNVLGREQELGLLVLLGRDLRNPSPIHYQQPTAGSLTT